MCVVPLMLETDSLRATDAGSYGYELPLVTVFIDFWYCVPSLRDVEDKFNGKRGGGWSTHPFTLSTHPAPTAAMNNEEMGVVVPNTVISSMYIVCVSQKPLFTHSVNSKFFVLIVQLSAQPSVGVIICDPSGCLRMRRKMHFAESCTIWTSNQMHRCIYLRK